MEWSANIFCNALYYTVVPVLIYFYKSVITIMANISYSSLATRMEELSRRLKQKDEQLDQELDEAVQASLDEID